MTLRRAHLLLQQGAFAEAEVLCSEIVAASPGHPKALQVLALIRHQQGRFHEALDVFAEALSVAPEDPELNFNYGNLLMQVGRAAEAICAYEITVSKVGHDALPFCNLGAALGSVGRITDSIKMLRRALEIAPSMAEARQNLASDLLLAGLGEQAIPEFRRAIADRAGSYLNAEIGLLFSLNLQASIPREQVASEHREWGRKVSMNVGPASRWFSLSREPDRPLRVGIVSADLKEHSVAAFLEPMLAGLGGREYEFFAYSETVGADVVTSRFRGYFSVWRDTYGLSDRRWSDLVRGDAIDILVDLGGHTTGSRLRAFALRPAPVQVSWLGYPNTTGLPEMDYRITDELVDPSGLSERHHTEELVRLAGGAWCYRPRDGTPPVDVRDFPQRIPVTFGCFNAVHKLNEDIFALWGRILRLTPGSILMLKAAAFGDEGVRELQLRRLGKAGVDTSRVRFLDYSASMSSHLACYNEVDIALDTYPYGGTTTTFEALHMGVPVVTKFGDTHASRVGMSILERLGIAGWAARTDDEYVEIAVRLAGDRKALTVVRSGLRARLERSSLMNQPRFSAEVAGVFRRIWRNWCERSSMGP